MRTGVVLVDTSALLALASPRDQYHRRAVATLERLRQERVRLLGTVLVLAELHGHLLYRAGPEPARVVTEALRADPMHQWMGVEPELIGAALERWMSRLRGRKVSVTDAVSFEVMRREKVRRAFAFDDDFTAAGYDLAV